MALSLEALEAKVAALEQRQHSLQKADPAVALSTDLIDLGGVPSCGIHKTDDQTINNATWTEITFGTTTWDTDGMADLTNNGITIQRSGLYFVTCQVQWTTEGTNMRSLKVRVNDTIYFAGDSLSSHTTQPPRLSCGEPRYFDIEDTITAVVYHNKGANDQDILGSTATEYGPQLTATLIADVGDVRTEMA